MAPRTVVEHERLVRDLMPVTPARERPLAECAGLALAGELTAPLPLPPFDNSAMDGYAVRAADVAGATQRSPVELPVTADIPAGRTDLPRLDPGTAHRIMTGAPLPPGADAVVQVEHTDGGTGVVRVYAEVAAGRHIRGAGEDAAAGAVLLGAGSTMGPAQLGLAAAAGYAELTVHAPPRVLVLSTGTELVAPGGRLEPGQIYESNGPMLAAAVRAAGARAELARFVADDVGAFLAELRPRLGSTDLVLTTGGVSAGAYEVVKDVFGGHGVEFAKVAMQPGMPQGAGRFEDTPVITLPGNPVSALVSFEVFVRPALLTAGGHADTHRPRLSARLTEPVRSPDGKRQFLRGRLAAGGTVAPVGGPGSHLIAAMARADCLIELAEHVTEVAAGAEVTVWSLR